MNNDLIPFEECPVGMFMHNDELCLMTEYATAYIVSTGERFWGGASTSDQLGRVMVRPVKVEPVRRDHENNDLISRKALLNDLEYYISHSIQGSREEYAYIRAKEKVEAAPAVAAAQGWISVEKRLPETEEWVAVWYCDKDGDYFPTVGKYSKVPSGKMCWMTDVDNSELAYPPEKITHWMPLPQGPKEAGE